MLADLVLFALLLLAVFCGWRLGMIRVLGGIGAYVLGYLAAREFSAAFAERLTAASGFLNPGTSENELLGFLSLFIDTGVLANRIIQTLAFVVIFIVVVFLIKQLVRLLHGVFKGTVLGGVDSVFGAFCLLVIFVILVNIYLLVIVPVFGEHLIVITDFINQSQMVLPLIFAGTELFVTSIGV